MRANAIILLEHDTSRELCLNVNG